MKKILLAIFFILPFSFASAQSLSIDDLDIGSVSVCMEGTLACQMQNAQLRILVQALLEQVVEALAEAQEEETPFYEEKGYLAELRDTPLSQGNKKVFTIENGEAVGMDRDTHAAYREVWRIFSTIVPEEYLDKLTKYTVYKDDDDARAAFVRQRIQSRNGRETEEWELSVNFDNLNFSTDRKYNIMVQLLAHEAGHIITLNEDQVDFFTLSRDCDNWYLGGFESCSKDDSYYTNFAAEFWDEEFYDWGQRYTALGTQSTTQASQELTSFYEGRQGDFATKYAATNPNEDIAESVMFFLTGKKPTGELQTYQEKISLFYQYDEMMDIRTRTRALLR